MQAMGPMMAQLGKGQGGRGAGGAGSADLSGLMSAMGPMMAQLGNKGGKGGNGPDLSGLMNAVGPMMAQLGNKGGSKGGKGQDGMPDLAGLMQTMGPMVAQMMGGKGKGGKGGRGAPQVVDQSAIEDALTEHLSPEEQAEWHRVLQEDSVRQASMPPKRPLSDAYMAGQAGRKAAKLGKTQQTPRPREALGSMLQSNADGRSLPAPPAALQAGYAGRLMRDLEDRVLSNPDYDPAQFQSTARLLDMLATARGQNVTVEAPEEDIYG